MSIADKVAAEIAAIMEAVRRNDLGSALQHQEKAVGLTKLALQAIGLEIESRELDQRTLGPLLSMQSMYGDIESCLAYQRVTIEHLAVVLANIQASRSGVVGQA